MNTIYIFGDWVKIDNLNLCELSKNPKAIDFLEENENFIDWISLAENANSFYILEKNVNKLPMINSKNNKFNDIFDGNSSINEYFKSLVSNPNPEIFEYFVKPYLEKCIKNDIFDKEEIKIIIDNLDLCKLYSNPNMMDFIYEFSKNFPFKLIPIHWEGLAKNQHPRAIELLGQNPEFIIWEDLIKNPSAIDLIKEINNENIDWELLSENPCQEAIDFILERFDNNYYEIAKFCGISSFSSNPFGLPIIKIFNELGIIKTDIKNSFYIEIAKNPNAKHILSDISIFLFITNNYSIQQKRRFYENLSANPCIFEEIIINLK